MTDNLDLGYEDFILDELCKFNSLNNQFPFLFNENNYQDNRVSSTHDLNTLDAQQTILQSLQQTSQRMGQQPTQQFMQQPAQQHMQTMQLPSKEFVEQPVWLSMQHPSQQIVQQPTQQPLQQLTQQSQQQPLHQPLSFSFQVNLNSNTLPNSSCCFICGDKATGKHYGAASCDGCKGFFRRSVRKNQAYLCRFNKICDVTKDKRNQCRYCRLRKCIQSGMKKEAVQSERDRICSRQRDPAKNESENGLSIKSLLNAETMARRIHTAHEEAVVDLNTKRIANIYDVCQLMQQQLLELVEWVKYIPAFAQLALSDQTALLRAHTGKCLLLDWIRRSLNLNNVLLLSNNCIITRNSNDFGHVGARLMDKLVRPLAQMEVDDTEFVGLKAIVFFDPNADDLTNRNRVKNIRTHITKDLQNYTNNCHCDSDMRVMDLIFVLSSLESISLQLTEQIRSAKSNGDVHLDNLLEETLLGGK